jgi:hypothetical protein
MSGPQPPSPNAFKKPKPLRRSSKPVPLAFIAEHSAKPSMPSPTAPPTQKTSKYPPAEPEALWLLAPQTQSIIQARGNANRPAAGKSRRILQEWATREGLKIAIN